MSKDYDPMHWGGMDREELDRKWWEFIRNCKEEVGENFYINSDEEKNNNFSSFEDIIYKNPAYTVTELLDLHHLALEGMGDE